MQFNKKTITTMAVVTALGLGSFGATSALAQKPSADSHPMSSLVEKIAQKFNLNESEVQAVFDEVHSEHRAEMKKQSESRLSQLVTDGKITESQKQLILQKRAEIEKAHEARIDEFKNMTPEQIKAQMESERADLEQWAKDNGINIKYLMPMVKGEKGEHGKFFMHIEKSHDQAIPFTSIEAGGSNQ